MQTDDAELSMSQAGISEIETEYDDDEKYVTTQLPALQQEPQQVFVTGATSGSEAEADTSSGAVSQTEPLPGSDDVTTPQSMALTFTASNQEDTAQSVPAVEQLSAPDTAYSADVGAQSDGTVLEATEADDSVAPPDVDGTGSRAAVADTVDEDVVPQAASASSSQHVLPPSNVPSTLSGIGSSTDCSAVPSTTDVTDSVSAYPSVDDVTSTSAAPASAELLSKGEDHSLVSAQDQPVVTSEHVEPEDDSAVTATASTSQGLTRCTKN